MNHTYIIDQGMLKRSAKPKLYELDLINCNGKKVRVIGRSAAKWEKVAMRLHFDGSAMEAIRRDSHFQTEQACRSVFKIWLEEDQEGLLDPRKWSTVVEILKEAGLGELSKELDSVLSN